MISNFLKKKLILKTHRRHVDLSLKLFLRNSFIYSCKMTTNKVKDWEAWNHGHGSIYSRFNQISKVLNITIKVDLDTFTFFFKHVDNCCIHFWDASLHCITMQWPSPRKVLYIARYLRGTYECIQGFWVVEEP